MARRKDYDLMNYEKYRNNRNNSQKATRDFLRLWGLASIANSQSEAKRKRRRRELDKKISKNEKQYQKTVETNGPITFSDIVVTVGTVIVVMLLLFLVFEFGLLVTLVVAAIVIGIFCVVKNNPKVEETESVQSMDSCIANGDRSQEPLRFLDDIESYQDVINNSPDVKAVECCLEALIYTLDQIMTYSEKELNKVGMSKSTMPQQKQYILDNYDTIIEQAKERSR